MDLNSRPAYQRGDRAPNFLLPTSGGKMSAFYDALAGAPGVLYLGGRPSAAPPCLPRLAALSEKGLAPVALFHCKVSELPPAGDGSVTLLADPKGQITTAYGGPGVCVLVDRNQRVLESFNAGLAAEGLEELEAPELPPMSIAPALIIPNVLDKALCQELIADWEENHQEGYVRTAEADPEKGRAIELELKRRQDHHVPPAKNQKLEQLVMRRIAPEIYKAFQFKTGGMQPFRVGGYIAGRGDYFRRHRDNSSPQTEHRKFALTLNLNDDFGGGGLTFPEYGDAVYHTNAGGAVVFSCSLLHEALPVTEGTRYVLLSFLYELGGGPKRL